MKVVFIFHYLHKYANIYVHTYIKQWKNIILDSWLCLAARLIVSLFILLVICMKHLFPPPPLLNYASM